MPNTTETPPETDLSDREKFFALLDRFPKFSAFWDRERGSCNTSALMSLGGLSSGEPVIRDILVSIWCGKAGDNNKIDITDLAALSPDVRRPLIEWLAAPFWP